MPWQRQDFQPSLPGERASIHPIPSQCLRVHTRDTHVHLLCKAERATFRDSAKEPPEVKEKHTNATGIRKTLRPGRGGEVLPPHQARLLGNEQLSTKPLKSKKGQSWNILFPISHHPRKPGAQHVCAVHMCFLAENPRESLGVERNVKTPGFR